MYLENTCLASVHLPEVVNASFHCMLVLCLSLLVSKWKGWKYNEKYENMKMRGRFDKHSYKIPVSNQLFGRLFLLASVLVSLIYYCYCMSRWPATFFTSRGSWINIWAKLGWFPAKATSRGRKLVQMASFSRKMSHSASPPGGKIAQMARHGVTRKSWQRPRPGWTPRDSGVNTDTIYWLMTSWYHHVVVLLINNWTAPQRNGSRLSYIIYASIRWSLMPWRRTESGNQRPPCDMSHITWHRYQSRWFRL